MYRKRIVPRLTRAGYMHTDDAPVLSYDVVEEWVPVEPFDEWTDWYVVEVVEDKDPTYYPQYKRVSVFRVAIKSMVPWRHVKVTWERKLLRWWVDPQDGPMGQIIDIQRKQE